MTAEPLDIIRMGDLLEAFVQSDLPFRVDIVDWALTSESFRNIIEGGCIVVQKGKKLDTDNKWPTMSLGDCIVINDSTYSPKEAWPFINYLDTGNITENRISKIQNLITGRDKIPSRARRKVCLGDIVYSTVRPNQKHFGLLKNIPENFLVSTGFSVIRAKSSYAHTSFIYWFLAQDHIVEYLQTIAEHSTSAYPSIRPTDIECLKFKLPPLPEQRAISHTLDALDDKIELNRRMSETLEEIAQALFKSWFVDFDPVRAKMEGRWRRGESLPGLPADLWELFPEQVVNSKLGQVPDGWKIATLNDVTEQPRKPENPIHSPDTLFSHFSIPAFDNGQTPKPEYGKDIKSTKLKVFPETVLLSRLNPEIERVWLVDVNIEEKSVCSTEFLILRSRLPFTQSYTYCLLRSYLLQRRIKALITGTSKSHQRVHADAVLSLGVISPPQPVVEAFDLIATKLLNRVLQCRREIKAASALRDTLLPKLISGELRVT